MACANQHKVCFLLLFLLAFVAPKGRCNAADTLRVVNWNLEYFGDGTAHDPAAQTAGVRQLMQAINADVYCLCEVVRTDSMDAVVQSLGQDYSWYVSPFGSFASSPSDIDYASAQKLGFVYRQSRVRNITYRALLNNSAGNAYYNFSSGRFPFLVSCQVLGADSTWTDVSFIILHAKAYTDDQSCQRRIDGCMELRDSLDVHFSTAKFLLLGDYNDRLTTTICNGGGPGNYAYMVNDSSDYKSVTKPLALAGETSIEGYTSFIDNVIVSNEMYPFYVPGSARVLDDFVYNVIPGYDNDVSDHYPVETKWLIYGGQPADVNSLAAQPYCRLYPSPAQSDLTVQCNAAAAYTILDATGRTFAIGLLKTGGNVVDVSALPAGIYCLKVNAGSAGAICRRFLVLH